jgi:hypothetical protein
MTGTKLCQALAQMVYEATHLSPCKSNGDHDCTIKAATLVNARAALAATPTPPTLSEDLREGDDEAPCTTCDDTGITWGTERPCACAAGAALAQVKAS